MLVGLSIRDIVLIDKLDLEMDSGLGVLTGETGAGKSILLDSLGLVTGTRAEARLVRPGEDRAAVSAEFALPDTHPVWRLLKEQGLETDPPILILRRHLSAEGRSRAWINDQPCSIGLLREIGDLLVEVHGQHGEQGLLDPKSHRRLLDDWADLGRSRDDAAQAYADMKNKAKAFEEARAELEAAKRDEDYLRHNFNELESLDPQPGEEQELEAQRAIGMHAEKIVEEVEAALIDLESDNGAETRLGAARARLERIAEKAGGRLDSCLAALERASLEMNEALNALQEIGQSLEFDPARQDEIEERLFALKDAARKHGCSIDELPAVRQRLTEQIAAMDNSGAHLDDLQKAAESARQHFSDRAAALSADRKKAAKALDKAVMKELGPLKLEKAEFHTRVETLEEKDWGPGGIDRVFFEISTIPGAAPGPLSKIASGGELSRIVLALKVVLAQQGSAVTLVFDEVDRGVGGAVADAVGERLNRLAGEAQVLVVTHSPQVAARGMAHWRVEKLAEAGGDAVRTRVVKLNDRERREEIARMLAGASVTDEARAAAQSLMRGAS